MALKIDLFLYSFARMPSRIVLGIDDTGDTVHGWVGQLAPFSVRPGNIQYFGPVNRQ